MKLIENKNENENSKYKLETIIEEFRIEDFEQDKQGYRPSATEVEKPRDYSSTDNDPKNSLKTANSSTTYRGSNEQNVLLRRDSEAVRSPQDEPYEEEEKSLQENNQISQFEPAERSKRDMTFSPARESMIGINLPKTSM